MAVTINGRRQKVAGTGLGHSEKVPGDMEHQSGAGRTRGRNMSTQKSKISRRDVVNHVRESGKGCLKDLGGSLNDDWNNLVCDQALRSLWLKNSDEKFSQEQQLGAIGALCGMAPRDELEGMLAAQLIAAHNAAMECYRRAMIGEQTFEGRRENLNQANKLSRTYAGLLEALNRHRGKGQQKVTVEHVHVHQGGQAIVGNIETGAGIADKLKDQPHAKQITHAPGAAMPSPDAQGDRMPVASDGERPMPNARR